MQRLDVKAFAFVRIATMTLLAGQGYAEEELLFPPGEDDRFHWQSFEEFRDFDLEGETISIFGPWLGPDKVAVENLIAYFEAATGAEVNHSGSDSFEQQVLIDAVAGAAANISVFPQPGLAADLASRGLLHPLGQSSADWVRENYSAGDSWVRLGTYAGADGKDALYGFFYKADVKSLVWYVPENFEDAGYEVPESMEELLALSDRIVAEGYAPWCIGLGSGAATGWPATDWVEDLLLRMQPPEVYDAWVSNQVRFDDSRIIAAIEAFGAFARRDDYVAGGARGVASTDFRDSPKGLFTSPPRCYMHRQASFVPAFFPDWPQLGLDVDFFYLPPYASKQLGKPLLGSAAVWAITKDSRATRVFLEFLKTPFAHEVWMAQESFLTPHQGVNLAAYSHPTFRAMGELLLSATIFRFDGSDLMPGAIGTGAFWTAMVDYVTGEDASVVAGQVQAAWDAIE